LVISSKSPSQAALKKLLRYGTQAKCYSPATRQTRLGNIYANESLFRANIHPLRPAKQLTFADCTRLVAEIRVTLTESIQQGGSTLRDFVSATGQAGYFQQNYWVYGRNGEPCRVCGEKILHIKQGQRASFYCGRCQVG
jgi:formamidopyrimidine-DNA glycosylase